MTNKLMRKDIYCIIALAVSAALCIGFIIILLQKNENDPGLETTLIDVGPLFIGISGVLSSVLLVFSAISASHLKSNKAKIFGKISKTTQKMHHFRSIADILFHSKIWLPGLREYIEKEFANLTYFEVKEFYKGKSRLAIEFLQETHHFGETENLYLEMKSLLMTHPDEKQIPETIKYPIFYDNKIIEKWAEHKCGSGLWYVFGFKYGGYRESINLDAVLERHQEKILTLANNIDSEEFEDSSFNEVFFAKLWEYMSKDVIPKLFQFHAQIDGKLSRLIWYLYLIFVILLICGVIFPLVYLMLSLPVLVIIISYSTVIATLFFIAVSFHIFLLKEADHKF